MKDHSQKCWDCGSKDLEDKEDHVKCRKCSATWNPQPNLGEGAMTLKNDVSSWKGSTHDMRSYSPLGSFQRHVAQERVRRQALADG